MKILNEYNILYIKAKIKKTCHIPKFTIIAFIYARQYINANCPSEMCIEYSKEFDDLFERIKFLKDIYLDE
jgi:hypothetical protein